MRRRIRVLRAVIIGAVAFANDTKANISVVMLGVFVLLAGIFSLSIDVGTLYATKRTLQSAVDLAAIKAVTNPDTAVELVDGVLDANGFSASLASAPMVEWGRFPPTGYDMDTVAALPIGERFEAGASEPNALRVQAVTNARLYLASLFFRDSTTLAAEGIAANFPLTQLAVRTTTATFDTASSEIFNSVLSGLLGTEVSLSALGYNGLARVDVRLLGFLDALATEIGLGAGRPEAVLEENVTYPEIADAVAATLLDDDGMAGTAPAAIAALNGLIVDLAGTPPFTLSDIIALDAEDPKDAASARVNLLDLLIATAQAANAQHGLTGEVQVPIAGGMARLHIAAIEPMQLTAVGGVGISARTAQARVFLEVDLLSPLSLLGLEFPVRFAFSTETSGATATVTGLLCNGPDPADGVVEVLVEPSLLESSAVEIDTSRIGQSLSPVLGPASLIAAPGLLSVTASAEVWYDGTPRELAFTAPFDANNFQTVSTTEPAQTAVSSLFQNLSYDVTILGLPLITEDTVIALLEPLLVPLLPALDDLVDGLLTALGVRLGATDIGVPYLRCSNPALIQ